MPIMIFSPVYFFSGHTLRGLLDMYNIIADLD
jgi:hypothetical protein